jgi:hypothetical protein
MQSVSLMSNEAAAPQQQLAGRVAMESPRLRICPCFMLCSCMLQARQSRTEVDPTAFMQGVVPLITHCQGALPAVATMAVFRAAKKGI